MKQNKLLLAILLSVGFYAASWADAYSNAYGRQAVMSPGGIPTSLSLNGMNPQAAMPIPSQPGYGYGTQPSTSNGVYLGGSPQQMQMPAQPMSMMNMNAMPQSMANTASYMAPQTNQYYSGSNFPQQQMAVQPMQMPGNYYAPPSSQAPNIGAFGLPPGTIEVTRPAYGVPAQLVQRNSSTNSSSLPYRAAQNMPLNPNSGMNMMNNNQQPQNNSQVMNILSGSNGQNASVMSILGANQPAQTNNAVQTSNNPNGAGTWVKKVFTRPASHKVSGW